MWTTACHGPRRQVARIRPSTQTPARSSRAALTRCWTLGQPQRCASSTTMATASPSAIRLVSTVQRVCRDDWHHFMPLRPEQHEAHGRHGALFANHAGRRARLHRCLSATSLLFGYIADLRLRRGQHIVSRAALTGRREAPAEGWGLVVPVAEHHGPRDERLRLKVVSWNLTWR